MTHMTAVVAPDWSGFQPVFTRDVRGRRILIFRVAFGAHYQDPHFLANANVAKWLYEHGHIDGVVLYLVWLKSATPAQHFAFFTRLVGPTPPDWLIGVEIDLETWVGQAYEQHSDHSADINRLYALICHYFRSWTAGGIYGNQYDLAELAPHRDSRAWVNVAAYTSKLIIRSIKGAIAQQYTDGETKYAVPTIGGKQLPRSTQGVASDHNVFAPARFKTGRQVRNFMRPPIAKPPAKHRVQKPPVTAPTSAVTVLGASPDGHSSVAIGNDGRLQLVHGPTTTYLP